MGRHNITVATYVTRTPVDQERKEIEGSLSNIDHVLLGNGTRAVKFSFSCFRDEVTICVIPNWEDELEVSSYNLLPAPVSLHSAVTVRFGLFPVIPTESESESHAKVTRAIKLSFSCSRDVTKCVIPNWEDEVYNLLPAPISLHSAVTVRFGFWRGRAWTPRPRHRNAPSNSCLLFWQVTNWNIDHILTRSTDNEETDSPEHTSDKLVRSFKIINSIYHGIFRLIASFLTGWTIFVQRQCPPS